MKRKFTPRLILASVVVAFTVSAGVLATSCQKEAVTSEPELSKGVQPQADWTYLDFTEDFTGTVSSPTDSNATIIAQAVSRVNLVKKDGWWQMAATSPEQAKISARLFEYIGQIAEQGNTIISEGLQKASSVPRTRMLGELPGDDLLQPNDCVARSVEYLSRFLKYPDANYAAANSFVTSNYGDGVPQSKMMSTLQHFYGSDNVSTCSDRKMQRYDGNNKTGIMVVYGTGPGEGHAVVLLQGGKDSYVCWDEQNKEVVPVDPGSVIAGYEVKRNQ